MLPTRLLLLLLSFSLFVRPTFAQAYRAGEEIAVSAPIIGRTHSSGFRVAGAFNGDQYLAVWEDARRARREIYATRFTREGAVLDPLGIPAGVAGVNLVGPKVVWTGSRYLVATYSDDAAEQPNAYLSVIGSDGSVLRRAQPVGQHLGAMLDIAAIANRVLMVRARPTEVFVDVLDESGELLEAEATHLPGFGHTRVAASQDRVLAVSSAANGVTGVLLTPGGEIMSAPVVALSSRPHPLAMAVASDGRDFLVVWEEDSRILGRRVTSAGTAGQPFELGPAEQQYHRLSAVWDEDRYVVLSDRLSRLQLFEIRDGDSVVARTITPRPAAGTASMIAGEDLIGLWYREDENETRSVFARALSQEQGEIELASAGAAHWDPEIRPVPGGFEAVWVETRNPENATTIRRAAIHEGVAGPPRDLVTSSEDRTVWDGHVRSGAGTELIVWRERSTVSFQSHYAIRARFANQPDSPAIEIAAANPANGKVHVTSGDGVFLITWFYGRTLRAVVIDSSRARLADVAVELPPLVIGVLHSTTGPVAAWSGEKFLVVWAWEQRSGSYLRAEVAGAFVERDGATSEPFVIETSAGHPAVASDGTGFLVAWKPAPSSSERSEIGVTRISPAGGLFDENVVVRDAGRVLDPLMVWTGREYVMTWLDGPYGARALHSVFLTRNGDRMGQVILAGGELAIRSHSLAAAGDAIAVAYTRPTAEAGGVARMFVRLIERSRGESRRRSVGR